MDASVTGEILRVLERLPDPRGDNVRHTLIDLLTIALCGVICEAGNWVAVVYYAGQKKAWFESFLELPCCILSHDTFGRVFARLDPEELEKCFLAWMNTLVQLGGGKLVAIDGKSLRQSFEHGWDKSGMVHMVSAFVQANRMVFAQVACDGRGRELDAIERQLKLLELEGSVVTIDALGCQVSIAEFIVEAKADYLLQVKDNQPTLHAKSQTLMAEAVLEKRVGWQGDSFQEATGGHGRKSLGDLGRQASGRGGQTVAGPQKCGDGRTHAADRRTAERRAALLHLHARRPQERPAVFGIQPGTLERGEQSALAVGRELEDRRRIRKDHRPENFSRLCRIALNLLKNEKTAKCGIKTKRLCCGWNNDYLLKVIAG